MGYADLHIHSAYSHDATGSVPAILKYLSAHTRITVMALTDHDSIRGNAEALDLAPRYGIEVIPGCEISTSDGHLVALDIHRPIPPGLSLIDTAFRVGEQGGWCFVPHPSARGTLSVSIPCLIEASKVGALRGILLGVEVYNGGLVYTRSNLDIPRQTAGLPLASLGNSDSHILTTLGQGCTEFAGHGTADLKKAILARNTIVHKATGLTGMRALREWAPRFALRKLGWVSWNRGPEFPIQLQRYSQVMR